ncbi:hypothetical protein Tco_1201400 [Tanacetum coccineum]
MELELILVMLLRINLLLVWKVNAAKHNLLLMVKVNVVTHKLTTASEKSEGFEQIVDFLNANPIRYALTINPNIYILCIEQFWSTVKAKTVNGEVQLQALVDGKKIIIVESTVGRDLQQEDVERVDCIPNSTIFEQLTLMGSKTTAWNKFSTTMASAIICLATNQKFNFSKYGMPTHNRIYIAPSHTKKIFRNMRRVGKGFSGRETPLFQTMVVQDQAEIDNVADEAVNKKMDDSLERASTTATILDAEQDRGNINKNQSKTTPNEVGSKELLQVVVSGTKKPWGILFLKLANKISSLKRRVKKLKRRNKSRTHRLKRMYRVGSSRRVESSKDEGLGEEDASKQGRIANIDANKHIYLVSVHTNEDMFGGNDLDGDEVIADNVDVVKTDVETRSVVEEVTIVIEKAKLVSAAEEIVNAAATTVSTASTVPVSAATTTTTTTATITDVEVTLAQALPELKSAKPKANSIAFRKPSESITTTPTFTTTTTASTRPKDKGIIIHEQEQAPTPTVSSQQPSQVKVQDKELAFKLQAKKEEEERLAREKAQQIEEVNIAWDDVQAKIKVDYQLAQRLIELVEESSKKAETELEENLKKAEAELVEGSLKRAYIELEQEVTKKQKVDDVQETSEVDNDQEAAKIKELIEIVHN